MSEGERDGRRERERQNYVLSISVRNVSTIYGLRTFSGISADIPLSQAAETGSGDWGQAIQLPRHSTAGAGLIPPVYKRHQIHRE